ncbi:unnamed protein product [Peronospora farinosa]|uniref:Uncharacterized protein n=1 Tax=Peronospora farinosa TaxID=134698 RepID=A0ABN8CJC3_9STRA|nr:unnamed protein product [Peronospora farinosa]
MQRICGIVMKHRYNRDIGRIGGLLNRNEYTTMDVESPFFAFKYHLHATLLLFVVSSGDELTHGIDNSGRYYAAIQ